MNWLVKLDEWMKEHDGIAPSKWADICSAVRTIERYKATEDKNRGIPIEKCLDLL